MLARQWWEHLSKPKITSLPSYRYGLLRTTGAPIKTAPQTESVPNINSAVDMLCKQRADLPWIRGGTMKTKLTISITVIALTILVAIPTELSAQSDVLMLLPTRAVSGTEYIPDTAAAPLSKLLLVTLRAERWESSITYIGLTSLYVMSLFCVLRWRSK